MRATLEIFAAQGWEGVQVEAVAERAGVHKTTIYRRWPTRGALVGAALAATPFREFKASEPNTGSLRRDLELSVRDLRTALSEERTWQIMRNLLAASGVPEVAEAARRFWASRVELSAEVFDRAAERGELAGNVDTTLLADLMTGAIKLRVFDFGERPSPSWYRELVAAMLRAAHATDTER